MPVIPSPWQEKTAAKFKRDMGSDHVEKRDQHLGHIQDVSG